MKEVLVTIALIIVGVVFAVLIAGDGEDSLKTSGENLLKSQIKQIQTLEIESGK